MHRKLVKEPAGSTLDARAALGQKKGPGVNKCT